jgi:hypothetical protein
MALYAIGDVQGCDAELDALLKALRFSADRDRIWFVGDLVNRGPTSLEVLRRVRAMGTRRASRSATTICISWRLRAATRACATTTR